jgi:hypothetical protein
MLVITRQMVLSDAAASLTRADADMSGGKMSCWDDAAAAADMCCASAVLRQDADRFIS